MNEDKISSNEVPEKFTEWLLAMGCPAERVPSVEIISEMCRGQYYMVWRSLMEKVDAKDVIRNKRMQVFCDDVKRCQKKNAFCEDSKTLVPEQLALWKQQTELRKRVGEAKERVTLAQRDLDQLTNKIDTKFCQRELHRRSSANSARRAWFLQQVALELTQKIHDLQEARSIADSFCCFDRDDTDLENKIDKCVAAYRRRPLQATQASLSSSNTSLVSHTGDNDLLEEQIWNLTHYGGSALGHRLYERRAALLQTLSLGAEPHNTDNKLSPHSVVAHTAALHCTLSLGITKNNFLLKQTQKRLADTIDDLNRCLTGESCELLVLRCEQAHREARVNALQTLLEEMSDGTGVFAAPPVDCAPRASLASVDKEIEIKKEELLRTMASLASLERKSQDLGECLAAVFDAFKDNAPMPRPSQYRNMHLDLPSETITELRQFYAARRDARRQKVDLSLDLELSDGSITDLTDMNKHPRYVDELRIYIAKFNLEKNRQLVLESGEKVWIFETIQASIERLYRQWLNNEMSCALLSPTYSLSSNIARLVDLVLTRRELEDTGSSLKCGDIVEAIDINSHKQEEEDVLDKVKKRLGESLLELQKVSKTFAASEEHLQLWSHNKFSNYISHCRTVDGIKYKDYENCFLENSLNV